MRSPFRVSTKRLDTAVFAGICTVYMIRYFPQRRISMPSGVARKFLQSMKVGVNATASPQASSTGVAPAKDALAWHASQQSSQQSQPQSQPQLLQESQPQPVPRSVEQLLQLLQAQPVRALLQELQPQVLQLLQPVQQRWQPQPEAQE